MEKDEFVQSVKRYEQTIEHLRYMCKRLFECSKEPKCVNCLKYVSGQCDYRRIEAEYETVMEMSKPIC